MITTRWSIVMLLVAAASMNTRAQRIDNLRIHAGFYALDADVKNRNLIRSFEPVTSPYAYDDDRFEAGYQSLFMGVAAERDLATKFGVSVGLQYARMSGSLEKNRRYDGPDYFYYRFHEEGTVTEYFRVREFQQHTHYVGVPLYLRYTPLNRNFKITLRAGTEVNLRIASGGSVKFVDPQMRRYEDQFINSLEKPDPLNVFLVIGAGISYGKLGNLCYGLEVAGPCVSLTQNAGGGFLPTAGGGLSVFVKVPLNLN